MSQNEGIALGHKYRRQTINSETQIRSELTSVHYKPAPVKMEEVERMKTKQNKTQWFVCLFVFYGNTVEWQKTRNYNQTSLVLPLYNPDKDTITVHIGIT